MSPVRTHFSAQNRRKSAALNAGAIAIAAILTLAGCSTTTAGPAESGGPNANSANQSAQDAAAAQAILAGFGVNGTNAHEVISTLDAQPVAERPKGLVASVRPGELVVGNADGDQSALPMPTDEFYLSIAPYMNHAHDCYFHSLTTCTGEMSNTPIHLSIVDKSTGEAIVDTETSTYDNGFIGTWLPRGIQATVTITADGKSATKDISTAKDDDATCVTDMHLA